MGFVFAQMMVFIFQAIAFQEQDQLFQLNLLGPSIIKEEKSL